MPLIPIGTEIRLRRTPVANWTLIGVNVAIHLLAGPVSRVVGFDVHTEWALDAARPALHQYVTYQFLHGDVWHLLGNMLFLWIFGNAVCDRMGPLGYLLFYLAGGVFAGFAFAAGADNPIVGASGAIAAVTTAFLVLYPRVHVTMLVWMFFIFTFQIPAMILIVFKIILWDNIIAPAIDQGAASNVAYSAHLAGYAYGFAVALGLLAVRALPRNPFDMVALWDRWRRRTGFGGDLMPGVLTARPVVAEEVDSRPLENVPLTPVEQLREEVAARVAGHDLPGAAAAYRRLMELDEHQVLARAPQLEIANHLAQTRRYDQAARAYEAFLAAYPGSADAAPVRLFLGLIYGRYLQDYPRAVGHLRAALTGLQLDAQRTLAEEELRQAEARLSGRPGSGGP
ncbi:MAG: rhomboid family intramembrane serine protease [Planctomycetota bacterium]